MVEQAEFAIPMVGLIRTVLAWMYIEMGAPDRVKDEVQALQREFRFEDMARSMQAQALIEMARLELAINEPGVGVNMLTQLITKDFNFETAGVDTLMWGGMVQAEYDIYQGNFDAALRILDDTIAAFEQIGLWREMPDALVLKGKILAQTGRESEVLPIVEEALSAARQTENRLAEWRILAMLADLEAKSGHAESAAQHRREGRAILDQVAAALIGEPELRASLLARPDAVSLMA
jgi:hypothetical protein